MSGQINDRQSALTVETTFSFSVAVGYTAQVCSTMRLATICHCGALAPLSLLTQDLPSHGCGWRYLPPPVRWLDLPPPRYFKSQTAPHCLRPTLTPSAGSPTLGRGFNSCKGPNRTMGTPRSWFRSSLGVPNFLSLPVPCSSAPPYGRSRQNF